MTFSIGSLTSFAEWKNLAEGIDLGHFTTQKRSMAGPSQVTILRIDPKHYQFHLAGASWPNNGENKTAKQWAKSEQFIAVINAGLFAKDRKTHIGYLGDDRHINNAHISGYLSAAAFGPKREGLPEFAIYDLDDPKVSMNWLIENYQSVVQNLRLIKKPGENRWTKPGRVWTEAALGEDDQGRALFIFTDSPYSMVDFNNELLGFNIGIVAAQHLEGGSEAQLYFNVGGMEFEGFGVPWPSVKEWPVPNVIGVRGKD